MSKAEQTEKSTTLLSIRVAEQGQTAPHKVRETERQVHDTMADLSRVSQAENRLRGGKPEQ